MTKNKNLFSLLLAQVLTMRFILPALSKIEKIGF
jgi:hypothetical protein